MTFLERDPQAPQAWFGNLPAAHRYTYGLAGERFFRALKEEGKILGSYCPKCDRTYVPASVFCERCLSELTEWREMGLVGELYTFTVLYVDVEGRPLETPRVVGLVSFGDGGIVHFLQADPESLVIGMPMRAVLKPAHERQGSILDIQYFEPLQT